MFAGIFRCGAGLGPAITFLSFAPAANILALAYTGVAIGMERAIARIILALSFGSYAYAMLDVRAAQRLFLLFIAG